MKTHFPRSFRTMALALPVVGAMLCSTPSRAQGYIAGDEQGMEKTATPVEANAAAEREAQNGWWAESARSRDKRMEWFGRAKFGCFVHWGVYARSGGWWKGKRVYGYAEHVMRSRRIPLQEYVDSMVRPFEAADFDADAWMRLARDAGMRYFVITAKHHDGFAMYPSDAYPYDIRMTRMKVDPMEQLARAARKYGIKFGFYYSHAFDWEHPEAPGNDWMYNNPGGDKNLHGREWWLAYPEFLPVARQYVDKKCLPQLKELVERYHPDILWFDTPHKLPLCENLRILHYLRTIAPDVVINGRLARTEEQQYGDYENTGDRAAYFFPTPGYWESIPTTNESYGYSASDRSHKPVGHFVRLLAAAAGKGGNILMNIGPKADGTIDAPDVEILQGIGRWMQHSGASIYGTHATGLPVQGWGETTQRGDTLFLHVLNYPSSGEIIVNGLEGVKLRSAAFLATGERVKVEKMNAAEWLVRLPEGEHTCMDSVVAVRIKGDITPSVTRLAQPGGVIQLAAFDAELTGDKFDHSDGKVNRNYVSRWTSTEGRLTWHLKTLRDADYLMFVNYTGTGKDHSGRIAVEIDTNTFSTDYEGTGVDRPKILEYPATIRIKAGEHTISLRGLEHKGPEFMRPISVTLIEK